jgi:hypothetical protein
MALLSLVAKLGLDKSGFEQGLSQAGKKAASFGSGLKATLAGAFGAGAMVAFVKGIADTVGRIKDLSEQFGVTTDEVQNIDYAMKQSGMSFEDFGNAMNKLGPARKEAATGNKELAETFAKFGVSAEDLQNPLLSNKDILMKVADAMRGTNVTAADQVAIIELLGPKAARLANVLAGLDGFQAPSIFTEDDIAMIDQMSKEFELFWRDLQISGVETGKWLMDTFNDVYTFLTTLFSELGDRWKDLLNPLKSGTAITESVNAAMEEAGKQAAAREEERSNAKAMREKDRADAKKKREEELKNAGPLFKDKPEKEKVDLKQEMFSKGSEMRSSDQLGRIGAFSGGTSNNVVGQLKKNADTLLEIRNVLAIRGIVIKDI